MLNNLYNFKKSSNHVKVFTFLWGVNPVDKFKTMCPYFWSWVATIFIFPLLLIIKALSRGSSSINAKLLNRKEVKREALIKDLQERMNKCATPLEAFTIYKSKCHTQFRNYVTESDKFFELYYKQQDILVAKRKAKAKKRVEKSEKFEEIKTNKLARGVVFTIISVLILGMLYYLGIIAYRFVLWVQWIAVLKVLGSILLSAVIGGSIYYYILVPLWEKVICKYLCNIKWEKTLTYKFFKYVFYNILGKVGRGIITGIVIFADTTKNIYKKQCPIIYWEEDSK